MEIPFSNSETDGAHQITNIVEAEKKIFFLLRIALIASVHVTASERESESKLLHILHMRIPIAEAPHGSWLSSKRLVTGPLIKTENHFPAFFASFFSVYSLLMEQKPSNNEFHNSKLCRGAVLHM